MPTTTISGTTALDDALIRGPTDERNYGNFGDYQAGNVGSENRRWVWQMTDPVNDLPANATAFRKKITRRSFVSGGIGTVDGTVNHYILLSANTWIEGTGSGQTQSNVVCGRYRLRLVANWAGGISSAGGTAGVDHEASAAAAHAFTAYTSGPDVEETVDLGADMANDWQAASKPNKGCILKTDGEPLNAFYLAYALEGATPWFLEADAPTPGFTSPNAMRMRLM